MSNRISQITYESKTTMGIIGIIFGFLAFILAPTAGLISYILIALPSIFLVIPSESTRNSKILGAICLIILLIAFFISLDMMINPDNYIQASLSWSMSNFDAKWKAAASRIRSAGFIQFFYTLINLISCVMLFTPTPKNPSVYQNFTNVDVNNQINNFNSNNQLNNRKIRFCSNCGKELNENAVFCSFCGNKINKERM